MIWLLYHTEQWNSKMPLIRTRGHRLEGMAFWISTWRIINFLRGIIVCVPRNMIKAAGILQHYYNQMTSISNECLNGYRIKEKEPTNYGEFTTPIGIPEIVKKGNDITVVSYGSTFNICQKAVEELNNYNISCELIDIQTLIPFDVNH